MKKFFFVIFILLIGLTLMWVVGSAIFGEDSSDEKIAIVYVTGQIFSSREKVQELKEYGEDESVAAVVLRVDSPGGAVAPSQEIYNEVSRLNEIKPVITSMGTVAASGGYYIAAPSKLIFANPGTLTGSIGVLIEVPNMEGLMQKIGITTEVIKSGKHKKMVSPFSKIKPADRRILQGVVDDIFNQFVEDVASARAMDIEEVKKLADGRIYSGRQAHELGLVDELGGLEDAIRRAAKLAGLEGKPSVVTKEEESSFWKLLDGKATGLMPDVLPYMNIKYLLNP